MRDYPAADPAAPTLIFGHGAGAGHEHPWILRLGKGLADRGVRVVTFNFPYRAEGRKLPDKPAVLEAAFGAVWTGAMPADRAADISPAASRWAPGSRHRWPRPTGLRRPRPGSFSSATRCTRRPS